MTKAWLLLLVIPALPSEAQTAPEMAGHYLYRATMVQAAPGKLLDLIELYKARAAADQSAGDEPPLWMRHSQGDHWDLMLLEPMSSYAEYFAAQRADRRERAEATAGITPTRFRELIAEQEDLYCTGPPLAALRRAFGDGGYFHIEMFVALPGGFAELYREREMENAYAHALGEPENFIFVRDSGAAWDIFTVGVFRDLKHYAESAGIPPEKAQAAARAAGFDSPAQIGPYLRRFIRTHHDTLAVAVK